MGLPGCLFVCLLILLLVCFLFNPLGINPDMAIGKVETEQKRDSNRKATIYGRVQDASDDKIQIGLQEPTVKQIQEPKVEQIHESKVEQIQEPKVEQMQDPKVEQIQKSKVEQIGESKKLEKQSKP